MKNKLLLGALMFGAASLFTACSDDNDSNPTLIKPTEFTVNTPAYINETVKLENTESLQLTWSQPKYTVENAPINVTYEIQVSPTNTFTTSLAEAEADESGATVADYAILDETFMKCVADIPSSSFDKALVKLNKWSDEAQVPSALEAYVRVNAFIAEGTSKLNAIASNVIKLNIQPYYIELKDAEPLMWYLVGNDILDGAWGNNPCVSSLPMMLSSAASYDKKTGAGEITYLNYMTTEGWKIQPEDFNWDLGFMGDGANGAIWRNGAGDAGNIWVDPAGYYLVTVNTNPAAPTCTIKKQDITPEVYGTVALAGGFNGWTDTAMTPANKSGENHVWAYVLTASEDTEVKFKIDGDANWTTNWGCKAPNQTAGYIYGTCTKGGDNIAVPAGTWYVVFNDIEGTFTMKAVK